MSNEITESQQEEKHIDVPISVEPVKKKSKRTTQRAKEKMIIAAILKRKEDKKSVALKQARKLKSLIRESIKHTKNLEQAFLQIKDAINNMDSFSND